MRRVVFLDFDGVVMTLASRRWVTPAPVDCEDKAQWVAYERLDPALVANVQRLCATIGADVVLSTAWRGRCAESNRSLLEALRRRGLSAPVVGWTPRLDARAGALWTPGARGDEITAWLDEHRPGWTPEDVVVLDDEDHGWEPPLAARWVASTFETGFGADELAEALRLFEEGT